MAKQQEFIKEYTELCLKYNLEITGCGECGSAWLGELSEEQLKHKTLVWDGDYTNIRFAGDYEMSK